MALYTETVMDHFMHPRNVSGSLDADGVGEVGNAKCGDIMKMYLKIKDNKIEDVKFETFGCSAIASSSIATEMIKGRTLDDALALTNQEVVDALGGLPAHKLHCSVLAEEAVKSAIQDYYEKNHIEYDHSKFPRRKTVNPAAGWYNAKHQARPLAVPGLSVKIRFFLGQAFPSRNTNQQSVSNMPPAAIFSLAREKIGEKKCLDAVGACCGYNSSEYQLYSRCEHTSLPATTAMVRAACYGTPNL